ncbi:MAG: acetyl-CoA carboxylase carboxyltransferase subunit alpha [Alphaproteobacteria bacterium]|nr:acetyl-CoA carboxylase carboxyltransferase subunit alpha [Alphaproteobacteria bacterium]
MQPTPRHYLDFEKPVLELAARVAELKASLAEGTPAAEKHLAQEIARLEIRQARVNRLLYRTLTPYQKVQVARHPQRPQGPDYIAALMTDFVPLEGDRRFGADAALVGGIGRWCDGTACVVLATDKGKDTASRVAKNFGMPKPEGYRKAQRLMQLAGRLGLPVVTLVDTPGAYPGIDAEERGQAEAIAGCLEVLMQLPTPVVSIITGEGGSGGALALAAADHVQLLEHSVYSVISPEGCAAILWKEATKETIPQAAEALKLTAQDLQALKLIDGIIPEPPGGAHANPGLTIRRVGEAVTAALAATRGPAAGLAAARRQRFLALT